MLRILYELEIVGAWDRGIPNQERIAIRPTVETDLSNYLLFLGVPVADQSALPLSTDLFWFGRETVVPPTWIILYTGPGERKITTMKHSKEPALVLHWGKSTTILNNPIVTPVIVSVDGIRVGPQVSPITLPK